MFDIIWQYQTKYIKSPNLKQNPSIHDKSWLFSKFLISPRQSDREKDLSLNWTPKSSLCTNSVRVSSGLEQELKNLNLSMVVYRVNRGRVRHISREIYRINDLFYPWYISKSSWIVDLNILYTQYSSSNSGNLVHIS